MCCCKCSEYVLTNTASRVLTDKCQPVLHLQPDQQRSFAYRAQIASHSVLANVASIALFAASRRRIVDALFVQQICCTSLLWLDAAEPIPAHIIRSARQVASDFRETAFEFNEQLTESCVFFGAPSSTFDRRIKGIKPSISSQCLLMPMQRRKSAAP